MNSLRFRFKALLSSFLLLVIIFGLGVRAVNLDGKTFWYDETYTAIPVSGYTKRDVKEDWLHSVEAAETQFTAASLARYQMLQNGTNLIDTLTSVGAEEAHNSPLYFVLARVWLTTTGLPTVVGMRSLSVIFGILSIVGGFLLCRELFSDRLTQYLGTALIATSPFHVLYSQEARQYSLLTAIILFSSAFLLRSIQSKRNSDWVSYGVLITLGLYSQLLFLLVSLAHSAYILLNDFENNKLVRKQYWRVTIRSGLVFLPWLIVIMLSLGSIADWRKTTVLSWSQLLGRWGLNIARAFYDVPLPEVNQYDLVLAINSLSFWGALLILCLIVISFYLLISRASKQIWLLVLLLAVIPALPFMMLDVVGGGVRSTIPRYFVSTYLAIELAIAYFLGFSIQRKQQPISAIFAAVLAIFLLILGGGTSLKLAQADTWWNKYSNVYDRDLATIIHASNRPLIIGDVATRLIALSHSLESDIEVELVDVEALTLSPEERTIFVYGSDSLIAELEKQRDRCVNKVYDQPLFYTNNHVRLWQLNDC